MFHYKLFPLTLLFSTLFFTACNNDKPIVSKAKVIPLEVKTIKVVKNNFPIWTEFTGTTKASSEQEVRARVSGRLEDIYFKDGAFVHKGDKLFKIEQDQYISNLNASVSKKIQDEASLALAQADVKRYEPLVRDGLAPRATLEQHQARRNEIKAQILADEAAIANAKLELSYTIIKAPVSGKVSARLVDVGNLVGYGESTLLTKIVQIDPMYVYFSPSERDAQKIFKLRSKKNLDAFIEVRGSGEEIFKRKRHSGVVDFSNNSVDALTSTITMRATIENSELNILPGTFVYVNVFVTDKYQLTMVPPQAILEDQLGKFVYLVNNESKAIRTSVEVGLSSKFYTVIRSGLKHDDTLIVSGLMKVKQNALVKSIDVSDKKGIEAVLQKNNLIPSIEN